MARFSLHFKKIFLCFFLFVLGSCNPLCVFASVDQNLSLPPPDTSITPSTLNTFVHGVLENNPAIQAAQSNVLAAEARQRASSNPLYNPDFSASGENAIEDTYSAGLSQTIDWTNKRGARAKVGYAEVQVAQAEYASLRQQLTATLINALASYQAAQRVVMLAKERTELLRQFVTLIKKFHASGDVARVDVDLAQLAYSQALAQQADAEVKANQALQTLMIITGSKQANWPKLPFYLPRLNYSAQDIDHFLYQLPSIRVLNNQYLSATARIRVAEKARYPDPTIGFQGGYSQDQEGKKDLVALSLSIPLHIRNTYQAEVDAANYDALQADQARLNLVRQSRAEIENSAKRYQILYVTTQQWQQISGKPLTDGITLIGRLWQANEITTTDYLVQLKQRIDSQISGAELKGQAWQAWAEWLRASGQIDAWVSYH